MVSESAGEIVQMATIASDSKSRNCRVSKVWSLGVREFKGGKQSNAQWIEPVKTWIVFTALPFIRYSFMRYFKPYIPILTVFFTRRENCLSSQVYMFVSLHGKILIWIIKQRNNKLKDNSLNNELGFIFTSNKSWIVKQIPNACRQSATRHQRSRRSPPSSITASLLIRLPLVP